MRRYNSNLLKLPYDCLGVIFEFFKHKEDVENMILVNKMFYRLFNSYHNNKYSPVEHIKFVILKKIKKPVPCYVRYLCVGCQRITDDGLKHLKNVHTLDLWDCEEITDDGLKYLKNVHTLYLRGCRKITDDGLKYLKNTHTLNLSGCRKITDDGLKHLKNVHILHLNGCKKITGDGFKHLKNVHTLELNGCKKITDDGLAGSFKKDHDFFL